ncbi:Protein of unknown function [Cotesia congregata]|uniref:Uncharacterized protein n=1 Tax=Cotesia congregata TaxID=51543 RepID=A0A8J2HB54_COTCN|nr:Protein of unknown function [Cotesia congregata]
MIEIISSKVVSTGTSKYFSSYIESCLQTHIKLFPGKMISKHHFLIHYPRIFEEVGVISQFPVYGMKRNIRNTKYRLVVQKIE